MNEDSFPHDENGAVLRRMRANGDNLNLARSIDFSVAIPDEQSAHHFSATVRAWGYAAIIKFPGPVQSLPWDVCVVKHMVPTHAAISKFEEDLGREAALVGGRNDGWGCFEQK